MFSEDELRSLRQVFLGEAEEHLEVVRTALAHLRDDPDDRDAIDSMLRELHTLKGAAGSVSLDEILDESRALEEKLVALKEDATPLTPERIETLAIAVNEFDTTMSRQARQLLANEQNAATASQREAERRGGDRRAIERRTTGPETIRLEVMQLAALTDTASQLVFDRNRIERRHQELERSLHTLREVQRAIGRLAPLAAEASSDIGSRLQDANNELDDALFIFSHAVAGAHGDTETLRQTSAQLQQLLHGARSVAIESLFSRVAATANEIATRAGRPIDVIVRGGQTQIDKLHAERLWQPMLHLVRNAVAHAFEPTDDRIAVGKSPRGQLILEASGDAEHTEVRVADDGRGIDRARVIQRLLETGRLTSTDAATIDDQTLFASLFESGMTTHPRVDDLAGRGVGLDVVRGAVATIGGTVHIASGPGLGTAFVISLPVSTVVKDAMLFKVGGYVYGVPVSSVTKIVQVGPSQINRDPNGDSVLLDGEHYPLVRLGALFDVPAPPVDRQLRSAIVVRGRAGAFAMTCDKIIGPREIVVRSLGPMLSHLPLWSGATVSGAGKVQLLLNLDALEAFAFGRAIGTRPLRSHAATRVLVADDSRTVRESTLNILQQAGFFVELASDGQDALELLLDRPFDLLITDLEMPRLNGADLIDRIRHSAGLSQLPILVMSSRSSQRTRAHMLTLGASRLISKPLRKRMLLEAIQATLGTTSGPHKL